MVLAALAIITAMVLKSNKTKQVLNQSQKSKQNSHVVSGGSSVSSGNKLNILAQGNREVTDK
jgi:hypothetical protein